MKTCEPKTKAAMIRHAELNKILARLKSVLIAYSGGLDSTFLFKAAVDALGPNNVVAVTARSETYPASEYDEACRISRRFKARHITVRTSELGIKGFKENPVDRCYYCKKELFKKLDRIRRAYGLNCIIDGTNRDDLKDVRYGRGAAKELGVRSPLLDAGITKADIRRLSKILRLPTWNKPSFACLASRIPFGTAITVQDLNRAEKAEEFVRSLGLRQVRVRIHGDTARIEVMPADLVKMMRIKDRIVGRFKTLGFVYITLDLEGYRTGSMHEAKGARSH